MTGNRFRLKLLQIFKFCMRKLAKNPQEISYAGLCANLSFSIEPSAQNDAYLV